MQPYINDFPDGLCDYITQSILPQYAGFDKAHRTDHALKVIDESMLLAQHYEVELPMVYTIAAYHDIGLCEGREFHHLVSGRMLLADGKLKRWFTDEQRMVMKEAVEDHRASNRQPPRSIYGKIVAEADRIIDPMVTLRRTVQYGLSNYPELSREEQYERMLSHMENKYAEGGYLKLWIPQSANACRLAELRQTLADRQKLRNIFNALYAEETGL